MAVDLSVDLATGRKGGLALRTPVLTASGVFGYGTEYGALVNHESLGAIVCSGVTLHPRQGNRQPRLTETPGGVLVSAGNPNIGVHALVKERAPIWASWPLPVIVNIAGENVEEFASIAAKLDGVEGVAAIEIDIGSPSYAHLAERFGEDPVAAAEVTAAVREATGLPLLVKLPLLASLSMRVAHAVERAGADALTLGNAPVGMAIDIRRRRPVLGGVAGGLSGPAIKPLGIARVYEAWDEVGIPIVGCGGVSNPDDVLEYLMAGAVAVQVGTALFSDPRTPSLIIDGVTAFLEREGIAHLREIVGAAHR